MHLQIADRAAYADATDLINAYGDHAAAEAEMRARKSRDLGNLLTFCRWRQAKRAVAILSGEAEITAIH